MTDVTIRGVEDEVYSQFSAEARKRGMSIGDLVTLVMRAFLEESAGMSQGRISYLSSLTVSQQDLEELEGSISFSDIGKLEFASDVKWETFSEKVTAIENVGRLTYPKSFPRLTFLAKCRTVGKSVSW